MNPEELRRLGKTANFGLPFLRMGRRLGRTMLAQEMWAQLLREELEEHLARELLSYPTRFERILDLDIL